jgi:hypothetical protein
MELLTLFLLLLIGIAAGWVGGIAGSGGIIGIPALLLLGVSPHSAIATHMFGAIGTTFSSFYNYAKHKRIVRKDVLLITILALIGAAIGKHP